MTEDVKLMAEFMGISAMCPRCFGSGRVALVYSTTQCSYCGGVKYQGTPDYPNDMNALLVVMDKMAKEDIYIWSIFDRVVSEVGLCPKLTPLLFVDLVEAIKQIKENE